MSDVVKIKQYGLTVEFSSDVDYHLKDKFTEAIQKQITDGVAAAAEKFEEDFFLPGTTIGKKFKMNNKTIANVGMQPGTTKIRVRTAEESIKTPEDNVSLYKDGDWSIARNKYLGLYILYKGNSMMFVASGDRKDMPDIPDHIRTKWKFLCEMDK